MSTDAVEIWSKVLPEIRKGVTGVGVWAALNACRPIAMEDGVLVVGLPHEDSELSGHLKVPSTKRLIEDLAAKAHGKPIQLRVIDGISGADWETAKRRDSESRRLQEQAMADNRTRTERGQASDKALLFVAQVCSALDFVLAAIDNYLDSGDRAFVQLAKQAIALTDSVEQFF